MLQTGAPAVCRSTKRPQGRGSGPPRQARRSDIDLLRVVACYLAFPFHSALIFGFFPYYHVKSAARSPAFDVFTDFVHQWRMPLFFLIAGWSAFSVLGRRTDRGFLLERAERLLAPLAFGLIMLCPVIKYIERRGGIDLRPSGARFGEAFDGGFIEFLPRFFGRFDQLTWSHLWFLAYLMVLSALWLPMLRRLARMPPLEGAGWLYALLGPLVLVQAVLRPVFGEWYNLYSDWASLAYFSLFFLAGALLARHSSLEDAVRRHWPVAATLAVVAFLARLASEGPVLRDMLGAIVAWGSVLALLGIFRRWEGVGGSALLYLRDSALPIYILHQLPVVAMGAFVTTLPVSLPLQFLAVLAGAVIATMGAYHVLVRPWPVMRRALGMRSSPSDPPAMHAPRSVE